MKRDNSFDLLSDKSELVFLIDRLLTDLLNETRTLDRLPCPFNCKERPSISVHDYLVSTQSSMLRDREVLALFAVRVRGGTDLYRSISGAHLKSYY